MKSVKGPDPIVNAVCRKLQDRSRVGVKKYGVTLAAAGLTRLQSLIHAQEEALDLANYLEVEIQREMEAERLAALLNRPIPGYSISDSPLPLPVAMGIVQIEEVDFSRNTIMDPPARPSMREVRQDAPLTWSAIDRWLFGSKGKPE